MIIKFFVTLTITLMLFSSAAYAEMEKDDHEISFSGNIASGGGIKQISIFSSYGLMITEDIQVKIIAIIAENNFGSSGFIGLGGEYYFSENMLNVKDVMPYAGGSLTSGIGDGSGVTFLEGHIGLKDFVSDSTALYVETRLLTDTSNILSENTFMLLAGISILLGQ